MACLHRIWSWMAEWGPYGLPALANAVLVFLGVWLSLPEFAEKVQKNPTYRRLLATSCITLGLIGFVADVKARHDSDQSSKQLIQKVGKALDKTNELLDKTNVVVANTSTLGAFTSLALPQIADLKSTITGIRLELVVARQQHDSQRVAALEAKERDSQRKADSISDTLRALGLAPILVGQLRDWFPRDYSKREDIEHDRLSEVGRYTAAHPDDTDGAKRIEQKWEAEGRKASEQSGADLKVLMTNADFVWRELIKWVPPQLQNPFDQTMEQKFARADLKEADPMNDAAYIEDLLKRVRPPAKFD